MHDYVARGYTKIVSRKIANNCIYVARNFYLKENILHSQQNSTF